MLADLEESLGTFQVSICMWWLFFFFLVTNASGKYPRYLCLCELYTCCLILISLQSTKAVYDRIIDLRIATPQIIINYAMFLEEHQYFEESFKVTTRQCIRCIHVHTIDLC